MLQEDSKENICSSEAMESCENSDPEVGFILYRWKVTVPILVLKILRGIR